MQKPISLLELLGLVISRKQALQRLKETRIEFSSSMLLSVPEIDPA